MPLFSPVGGGGIGKATVTGTTGSPTVDTTSRPGKTIYIFNGSGSVTVGTAGTCELLVIGGGGSGGHGGGGGAGGYNLDTAAILPSGTLTVTVGGGGAGVTGTSPSTPVIGNDGNASRLGNFIAIGGGAGGGGAWQAG